MTKERKGKGRAKGKRVSDNNRLLDELRTFQTKRCQKYAYAPIDLTLFPRKQEKDWVSKNGLDALLRGWPKLPEGKVDIQICDDQEKLSRCAMPRREALLKLLNQAIERYQNREKPSPVTLSRLHKKTKSVESLLKKTTSALSSKNDGTSLLFLWNLSRTGFPLGRTVASVFTLLNEVTRLENLLSEQMKAEQKTPRKSPNSGDGWFHNLMDDLCKIWIVIFELDVTRSNYEKAALTKEGSERIAGGGLVRFIGSVFRVAGIKKSNTAISSAIQAWKKNPYLTMMKLEEEK